MRVNRKNAKKLLGEDGAELIEQARRMHGKSNKGVRGRAKVGADGLNATERRYRDEVLEPERRAGIIDRYDREPEAFNIGIDCRYVPDFRVIYPDGLVEFREVKGSSKDGGYHSRETGLVKIRAAAQKHPYSFVIVWWNRREKRWDSKIIEKLS